MTENNNEAKNDGAVKYLVFDIESVPDGKLIKSVKFPGEDITEEEAIEKLKAEILAITDNRTEFIPVTFQLPISLCIAKISEDFLLLDIVSLDEPDFRPKEMTRKFWYGVESLYKDAALVTFNGRGFDLPLMELMAFRYGNKARNHFVNKFGSRYRFGVKHIDLQDFYSNFSAIKMAGGLNLLAKVLGKPGKMDTKGDEVHSLYNEGKMKQINDYCFHDVLDTYFVFLRSRVLIGAISIEREQEIVSYAKKFLEDNHERIPALKTYLDNWGDWNPWP